MGGGTGVVSGMVWGGGGGSDPKKKGFNRLLTLPLLCTYIYVTFIFPMEGSLKVHLQFVHSSVLRYIFMYNVMSDFCGASEGVTLVVQVI